MSNPITKLPKGDNQTDQNATRSSGNGGANRPVSVSVEQGKEIFGQVNLNLQIQSHDHLHQKEKKEKSAANKPEPKVEEQNQPTIHREKSSTPKVEKKNAGHEQVNDLPEQPHGETAKNNSRILAQSNKQQSVKLIEQLPVQTSAVSSSNADNQKPRLLGTEQFANLQNKTTRTAHNFQSQLIPPTKHLKLTINNHSTSTNHSLNNNYSANAPSVNSHSINIPPNNLTGETLRQVFRESNVYLSRQAVDNLIAHCHASNSSNRNNPSLDSLPKEIFRLIETIENQLTQTSPPPRVAHHSAANQITLEIPQSLDEQIRQAANLLTEIFGAEPAGQFSRLDTGRRMLAAVEVFLTDLPDELPGNLRTYSPKNVLDGFLLTRGLLDSGRDYSTESLLAMMRTAATGDKVSLAAMRDLGGLIRVLILDAAAAKSIVNLETAVEKFARILIAANRLDAVLTAVKLANQSEFRGGNVGRTVAIAQVYELINRLVLAGERAMNEAAARASEKNAAVNESNKNARSIFPAGTIADLNEPDAPNKYVGEPKTIQADGVLRQFLEFNPLLVHDQSLSAFENSDSARQAQNDFLDRHQTEIEQWLRSGNHRLVKDIDFEKPLGIVVERGAGDFLSATTARIVLVRDSSAQGWHFLKSFLIA